MTCLLSTFDPCPMPSIPEMLAKIAQIEGLAAERGGIEAACALLAIPRPTYYRWKKAVAEGEKEKGRTGRPPAVELEPAEVLCLRWHRAHMESDPAAIAAFANHEAMGQGRPPCPHPPARPSVRAAILAMKAAAEKAGARWHPPLKLRQACTITAAERAELRGERARMADSLTRHRSQTIIVEGEDGLPRLELMQPGTGYVSDDMSLNTPFRFEDADKGREMVGRQSLMTRDIMSLKWLGATLIGRARDAYRVEDIADHCLDVVESAGVPVFWRIERGPWNNNFFFGAPVPSDWGLEDGFRFGGLNGIMKIRQKFSPRGKGEIESGFRIVQHLLLHRSTDIGRKRGEFETAAKLFRRASLGDVRALNYFWSINEAACAVSETLAGDNTTPHLRAGLDGRRHAADDLWTRRVAAPLPASEAWRFCPIKIPATVRSQCVHASSKHYAMPFQFRVSGADGMVLGKGHKVFMAFHPGRPEEGCVIFNAETSRSTTNRDGLRFMERLGVAPWVPPVPQEDLTGRAGDYRHQKAANAAVRSEFRGIVPNGTGPGTLKSTARDGLGTTLKLARGGSATPAPAPAVGNTRPRSLLELVDAGRGQLPDESASPDTTTRRASRPVPALVEADAWDAL